MLQCIYVYVLRLKYLASHVAHFIMASGGICIIALVKMSLLFMHVFATQTWLGLFSSFVVTMCRIRIAIISMFISLVNIF